MSDSTMGSDVSLHLQAVEIVSRCLDAKTRKDIINLKYDFARYISTNEFQMKIKSCEINRWWELK